MEAEGASEAEIKAFRQNAILKKSMKQIQQKAKDLDVKRHSPGRFKKVKSVVGQNLKTQRQQSRSRQRTAEKLKDPNKSAIIKITGHPEFDLAKTTSPFKNASF